MIHENANSKTGCPRVGEKVQQIQSRESRLYSVGADWFFSKREGVDEGPFVSKKDAEDAINNFIRKIAFNLIRDDISLN